jgi:hypothetical protein
MSSRFNNKRLLLLLSGLITILLLTVVVKIPREQSTLKSRVAEFDSSMVDKIILIPATGKGNAFEFHKENAIWRVQQGNIISATQPGAVQNLLNDALAMKPQSLAAVKSSAWKEFEITDSLATRVKFLDKKGKTLADLMIGKLDIKPMEDPYSGTGRNNVRATSYVRQYSDQKVYAVDGMMSFSFDPRFDDWRDKTFIKSNKNDITGIRFIYPADSSFSLSRKDNIWQVNDRIADSTSVANYLASLVLMNGESFKDNFKPVTSPVYQISVEGNNLLNITVKGFQEEGTDEYVLNSSLNPDVYFTSKRNGLFNKIFKERSSFLNGTSKPIR